MKEFTVNFRAVYLDSSTNFTNFDSNHSKYSLLDSRPVNFN
jgi:hypothetical protein